MKAHPPIQLLPLIMAMALPFLSGCVTRPTVPVINVAPDKNPIVAALTHFHSRPDLLLSRKLNPQGVLLVSRNYKTKKGFISANQLASDLKYDKWTVPEHARYDMERHTGVEKYVALRTRDERPFIRVVDFRRDLPGETADFIQRYPEARCYISLWPPGYTADRTQVVVRFSFGPSLHGASAVYLLERRADGMWHVLKHGVAYYA